MNKSNIPNGKREVSLEESKHDKNHVPAIEEHDDKYSSRGSIGLSSKPSNSYNILDLIRNNLGKEGIKKIEIGNKLASSEDLPRYILLSDHEKYISSLKKEIEELRQNGLECNEVWYKKIKDLQFKLKAEQEKNERLYQTLEEHYILGKCKGSDKQ